MTIHVVYDRDWTWWLSEVTSLLLLGVVVALLVLLVANWRRDCRNKQ